MTAKKPKTTKRQKGLHYPVNFVAAELGVDRVTLVRRLEEMGRHPNGAGITFAEAYEALTQKSQDDVARRRRINAEATRSEVESERQQKLYVYREQHVNCVTDLAVQTRVKVESATYLPRDGRKRLLKELADIKPSIAAPADK